MYICVTLKEAHLKRKNEKQTSFKCEKIMKIASQNVINSTQATVLIRIFFETLLC